MTADPLSKITPNQFEPGTIWFTGLPASGKTTLARALAAALRERSTDEFVVLDGDAIRAGLPQCHGHSLNERAEVLRHIVKLAAAETVAGRHAIVATVSHQSWMREHARRKLQPFFEVLVNCPPSVCAARDVKGHWARALDGGEDCFIGVTHAYEVGKAPDLVVDTANLRPIQATTLVVSASVAFLAAAVKRPASDF